MKRILFITLGICLLLYGCGKESPQNDIDEIKEPSTIEEPSVTEEPSDLAGENVTFKAIVLKKDGNSLLVITMDDAVFTKLEPVSVSFGEDNLELSVGDMIEITFSGIILESYPAQIGADSIELQEKAESAWPATSNIPMDYNQIDAQEDNCFVITYEGIYNEERLLSFVENTGFGIAGLLRKVEYTVEGDPIITDYLYDGTKYMVIQDITRDSFAGDGETIIKKEFRFFNTYDNKGQFVYYLSNTENMTNEEYEESKDSFVIFDQSVQ